MSASPSSLPPTIYLDVVDMGRRVSKEQGPFVPFLRQHFNVELVDDPDFLIYSDGSEVHRLYTCKKIYWTPEVYRPDFSECDYAITTHLIDDPRHLRLPLFAGWIPAQDLIKGPGEYEKWRPLKKEFCCYFSSYVSRKTRHRHEFFENLSRYRQVHAAGKAFNNIGRTIPFDPQAKHEFLSGYKFYMAFENTSVPGYTTEKIVEAMRARCIPIYWGNPRIAEDFNPASFINAHDFPSPDALIKHIRRVDQDEQLYRQYLEAPFFHDNKPSPCFGSERLLQFFRHVFSDPTPPVASRRRNRWMLIKRKKPHRMSWMSPETPRPVALTEQKATATAGTATQEHR
jgi:hypothetical protein